MAELTAIDRKQKLLDSGPQAKDYMINKVIGRGKNAKTVSEVDQKSLDAARTKFLSDNKATLDALDRQIGNETTQGDIKAGTAQQVAEYLKSPTHDWYSTHGGREAFGLGALGGYGLGRLTLPVATAGSSALNRARILGMAAGEAGLGPAAEWLVSGSGPENPHGQDVDQAYGNMGLGESFGAGAAGLFKASHGAFGDGAANKLPAVTAAPAPPLKSGTKGTGAVEALADYLGTAKGKTRAATWANVEPALKAADEATIRNWAKAMPAAELGGIAPESADIFKLRDQVIKAAERWGTKSGVTANVKAVLPEALGMPALAAQAVGETMFPGALEGIQSGISENLPEGAKSAISKYTDIAGPAGRGLEALHGLMVGHLPPEELAARKAAWEKAQAEKEAATESGEQARMAPIYARLQQQYPQSSQFDDALNEFKSHVEKIKGRQQPQAPMPQPQAPAPAFATVPQQAYGISPGTNAFLQSMMAGRNQSNALALLMGARGQ